MMDGRYLPLIALGGGIMGGRLGRGLQGFAQATMQGQQFERQGKMDALNEQRLQYEIDQAKAQDEARRQQAAYTQQALAGLPEDQRALVLAGGAPALAKLAETKFTVRKPELVTAGNRQFMGVWNPETNSYDPVAGTEAPRWQPQAPTESGSTAALKTREARITDIMSTMGKTRAEAIQLVDGLTQPTEELVSVMKDGQAVMLPRSQAVGLPPADRREDKTFDQTTTLRKEFEGLPEVKGYKEVIPVVKSAMTSAGQDTRAADLDLVFAVGKTLDPTSVVREGEQIMIASATSPANQISGYISYLSGGGRFTAEQRQELLTLLKNRATEWQNLYTQRVAQYRRLGSQNSLDASQIVEQLPNIVGADPVPPGGVPNFAAPAPNSAPATERRSAWGLR